MKELDCRGLVCPEPVLRTKTALDEEPRGLHRVLVDNAAARENVSRLAMSQGWTVETTPVDHGFCLTLTKDGGAERKPDASPICGVEFAPAQPRLVVRISSQTMGSGSEELGRVLMKAFLKTLSQTSLKPEALLFYNSGVFLTCAGSEHIESLTFLVESGVRVLSCGTCLDYFNLKDKLSVGQVTNMFEIIETLSGATRVVSP